MDDLEDAVVAEAVPARRQRGPYEYFMAHTAHGPVRRLVQQAVVKGRLRRCKEVVSMVLPFRTVLVLPLTVCEFP